MKMQSFWGSICLINLVLGAAQGCESDEMEFEPTVSEFIFRRTWITAVFRELYSLVITID